MLEQGADPNVYNDAATSPLFIAIKSGDHKMVDILLQHGAVLKLDDVHNIMLWSFVLRKPDIELVNLLRDFNIDISSASLYNNIEKVLSNQRLMDLFKSVGVDINYQDAKGNTILSVAVDRKESDKVKFILSKGADPNIPDDEGKTPLHKALDVKTAHLLIDNGADINAQDKHGDTPVITMVKKITLKSSHQKFIGLIDVVAALSDRGADFMVENKNRKDAIWYIKKSGNESLIDIAKQGYWEEFADDEGKEEEEEFNKMVDEANKGKEEASFDKDLEKSKATGPFGMVPGMMSSMFRAKL